MARVKTPDTVSMATELYFDVSERSEATLSWHFRAMARGETKGDVRIPRFIVTQRDGGIFGTDQLVKIIPVEDGETDRPRRLNGFTINLSESNERLVLDDPHERHFSEGDVALALAHVQEIVPLVAAAEPLTVDHKIATLLIPPITMR
jgi:hypothetical protein